jgi:hypothetical protein
VRGALCRQQRCERGQAKPIGRPSNGSWLGLASRVIRVPASAWRASYEGSESFHMIRSAAIFTMSSVSGTMAGAPAVAAAAVPRATTAEGPWQLSERGKHKLAEQGIWGIIPNC